MKYKTYDDLKDIKTYFKDIADIKTLTRKEERELILKAQSGDKVCFDKIVEANLKFVISTAKEFKNCGVPFQDLISEGNLGLIRAVNKFDCTKGTKFITYAVWWIKNAMYECINKFKGKNEEYVYDNLDICDSDDLMEENEYIVNSDVEDDLVNNHSRDMVINELMKTLKDREKRLLIMYFGLDGNHPLTLKEISEKEGNIVEERARQIVSKALDKLKSEVLVSDNFEEYKELC